MHAAGSYFFLQLWAVGRAASPEQLREEDPSFPYVSASDVKLSSGKETPRPLTVAEIQEYVGLYSQAAKNALRAGFDGVEVHGPLTSSRNHVCIHSNLNCQLPMGIS